jgi:uncharacterized membrane protein YfcA
VAATTPALLVTGVLIGVLSGMLGIGGAVVLVPVLLFVFKFSQPMAQGTSIGALVPPIGIFAALQYYRNGFLDLRVAGLIALGFVFGAFLGAAAVPFVPQLWLKRVFATILVYVAVRLFYGDVTSKIGAVLPGALAAAALWSVYLVRRALGHKVDPPKKQKQPPPGDVYYI